MNFSPKEQPLQILKWLLSMALGVGVALLLFGLMIRLVSSGNALTGESPDIGSVNFVRLKIEEQVKVKERRRPEEPPPPKKPPPPKRMEVEQVEQPDTPTPEITIPNLNIPSVSGTGASIGGFGLAANQGAGDRNSRTMLRSRIDPVYPQQAAMDGLEGYVEMRVTIGKEGSPTDVEVLDYSDRVFVNPARRAIFRWRWEPAYENGEPVEWTWVIKMPFTLNN
ncbi:energy transducer TonB [Pelagicoccus albus]|uniref:Energy transducer TonB n=1 Tax=Pelagicoccus albus TaxID=415222 RepID=A0A7X1B8T9_9BACT|nr:energy transducer TonB [Pelagicoccus albus]MBC2607810.1 energy transducer TonB [Pelagicoccus albus]